MIAQNDNIWHGAYKIPWDDPDFSRRMLAEHLAQDHDMASRRAKWIDRQVEWIHNHLLNGQSAEANWTGLFEAGERVRLRLVNAAAMSVGSIRI